MPTTEQGLNVAYGLINADVIQPSVSGVSLGAGNATIMKNRIINGSMQIWQRGTSFAAIGTGIYSADRWKSTIAGTSTNLTASQDTSTPSLDFKYSLKYQQITTNATSVTEYATRQAIELANVQDLAGKSVTISFWYRSNLTGTHGVRIIPSGTTGGVDTSVAITVSAANTWEYKTVTTTALAAVTSWGATADNATALILDIGFRVNTIGQTTVNANDYFNLVGVQLEVGTSATGYEYRQYGQELALCQRYFQLCAFHGVATSTGEMGISSQFKVTMRSTPSMATTLYPNDNCTGTANTIGRIGIGVSSTGSASYNTASSGNNIGNIICTGLVSANVYFGSFQASAEL